MCIVHNYSHECKTRRIFGLGYNPVKFALKFRVIADGRGMKRYLMVPKLHQMRKRCWKPPSPFSNLHFRNTTKILQHKFLTLNFLIILLLSLLKVSFPQTMSFSCIFVFAPSLIRMDLSIVTSSTSLTFSGFLVLFSSISLLFSFIESHFALSSAKWHL